jgi:NAD(P)-dependent dehydrogenase (short-subunit alcohol dehydrogenase family)
MGSLNGKAAIVTGGDSGIGRAVALAYHREGAKVVVVDCHAAKADGTAQEIEKTGGQAFFVQADVSIAADCARMVAEAVKKFGRLDIACNNAGIGGEIAPTADYGVDAWQKVIGVNLSGVFYGLKYEIPELLKVKGGAIVNIASVLGQVSFAGSPAYVAAKHGVVGLTQNAAVEYAAKGIRVNSVGPGFIKTAMVNPMIQDRAVNDALVALHPMGRLGESEEVAELVLWLSSPQASFVTGAYYPVDGGYLAR